MENLFGVPTVKFCEKPTLGIIARPWYAVSNLAYILVGLLILSKAGRTFLGAAFGFMTLAVGTLSFIYDATYLRVTQLFDIAGMMLLVGLLIFLSLNALYKVSFKRYLLWAIPGLVLVMATTFLVGGQSGNIIFGTLAIVVLVLEYVCYKKGKHQNYQNFISGLVLMAVGFAIWLTDVTQMVCFKIGLFNGRSIFHYLTAATIYLLYLFYASQKNQPELK